MKSLVFEFNLLKSRFGIWHLHHQHLASKIGIFTSIGGKFKCKRNKTIDSKINILLRIITETFTFMNTIAEVTSVVG